MSRPTLKGAINHYRHNRSFAPPAQQSKAGFEGCNFSVFCACSFREKTNTIAFFEFADDILHCRQIGCATLDWYSIDRRNQPAKEPVFKERITGKKEQRPLQRNSAKDRVKKALVVTDQDKSALLGDIFPAVNTQMEK